jgi:hypothetical protein
MPPLGDLHRAVQTTLASKRLGCPVFARYTLQGVEKDALVPALARAAGTVRDWMGQPLDSVYAVGSVESGHVSLTLRFRDGATALVSAGGGAVRGDGVDLMVVGNRGALYHDAGGANLWDEPATADDRPDPALRKAVEEALRAGKPARVETGGKP